MWFALAVLLTTPAFALSRPKFASLIPNGFRVPDPCYPALRWNAVGHKSCCQGTVLNPFGRDFLAAGKRWTRSLCLMDSDMDGRTNGEELGDPYCRWSIGQSLYKKELGIFGVTHPGIFEPYNHPDCALFRLIELWEDCPMLPYECPGGRPPITTQRPYMTSTVGSVTSTPLHNLTFTETQTTLKSTSSTFTRIPTTTTKTTTSVPITTPSNVYNTTTNEFMNTSATMSETNVTSNVPTTTVLAKRSNKTGKKEGFKF